MSKFYVLDKHSVRKSSIKAVSGISFENYQEVGNQHGFYIYFDPIESWWIGYDKDDMAVAQRAKLMEALEEGDE